MSEWAPEKDGTVARYNASAAAYIDVPTPTAAVLVIADTDDNAAAWDVADYPAADITLTDNATITLSNVPDDADLWTVTVVVRQGDGPYAITWPTTTHWAAGTAPTLSATEDDVDVFRLTTFDGGTIWFGEIVGQAYAAPA